MRPFSKFVRLLALGLCCVLLVFMSVELAHAHPLGAPDTAHCQLCLAAHIALYRTIVLAACLLLAALGKVVDRDAAAGFSVMRSTRRIRPPPGPGPFLRIQF